MKLTDREIEFLVRLLGHHIVGCNPLVEQLYTKLAEHAEWANMRLEDRPLDVRPASDETAAFYPGRTTFRIMADQGE